MLKKIIFWIYAAVGPLFIVGITFGESLWSIKIPVDYMYMILVGIPSMVVSLILMIIEVKFLAKHKWLRRFTPFLVYLWFTALSFFFVDGRLGLLFAAFYAAILSPIYVLVTHLTLWVYWHWVSPKKDALAEDQGPLPVIKKVKRSVEKVLKVTIVTVIMLLWPIVWFGVIIIYNSEISIHYKVYQYENDPTSENLAELTIELINYRGYEERLIYLPKAMNDETVLQILAENQEMGDRSRFYSVWDEPNISYAYSPEYAKALIMTQYINAYLFLGRDEEYLDLMKTRTEQNGDSTFYYMFIGNVMMYNSEYEPKLKDMLILLEDIYNHIEIKDKTDYQRRFYNIRIRQNIYYLLGDEENDARLQIEFDQVIEEMKAYVDAQENK